MADVSATVCVGALVFVVLCTRPAGSGLLSGPGFGELRWAAAAAMVWLGAAVLLIPFSAADAAGMPLVSALANLPGLMGALEQPKAWGCSALLVLIVAVGARMSLRWQAAALWCGIAVFAVLPPLMTAHGSSDAGHDLSLAALVVHVPAAMIWFGLLLALLRRAGGDPAALVRRYDRIASWCWVVLALSGLVLTAVLVPPAQLLTSPYGLTLVIKAVLAMLAGVAGRFGARRAARWVAERPGRRGPLVGLLAAEVVLLSAVIGISVGLSHLSVPDFLGRVLDTAQTVLGYDLPGPPTVLRLLGDWRPDLFFGPLAVVLAGWYVAGVRGHRGAWPRVRTATWLAGCLVLVLATSSGIGRYAAGMFSLHQASHMLAPALLVQGAPLTLRSAVPGTDLPGSAELIHRIAGSRLVRALTHPVAVLVLFAGAPFLLYFTGLFDALVRFHWGHLLINAVFLGIGYLFFWVVAGTDPGPRPLPGIARLGLLLAAMPADVVFGAFLISTGRVVGNGPASSNMYQALALPWVPGLAADQRAGGLIALVIGEAALAVVLAALLARWSRDGGTGFAGYDRLARSLGDLRGESRPE
ncbi:bifunctional copper resistance protein CopD/cytochrome c oxidase assembly protein [Amycolatopsis jejuensis]|uniref:bifunctional copper resistance protein CopD/cytochrome c oxidase assembly protein n=1 Tax=Amycolatopsis jejuensis TaxID=330084 RepID=UPI000A5278BE|nr:bifunctional copper resistance protein CopD/cytochrome c oxidase assembly protein [Amycolatopsis jejuensis]